MVQPALLFELEPVPRLPVPAVGPKGPKIGPKTQGRIYHCILPKVCPSNAPHTVRRLAAHAAPGGLQRGAADAHFAADGPACLEPPCRFTYFTALAAAP